ncbi:MAG: branched-chain amino acid:cation transporter, family [Synergistales bacterium]|jgi:LIVCS family branched-chain amino acid:cation transporter|nr:branched-chain amino acid:cation transporter, family [Synergistales bacterium]MDN5336808.1 branched-chain amino acid:cation transporter, family [Synergistales bacterium]
MERVNIRDVVITGFALFAMFFGAGNLIFPPYLGSLFGTKWLAAMLGFGITGIGLPLLGVIVMSHYDGSFEKFADKGGKLFGILLGTLVVLCIGPLLAIPRTGATTFEVAVKPFFPNINSYIPIIGFFALTYYFSIKQSSVIDIIGKILTPGLLILLLFIIISGIVNPIGALLDPEISDSAFASCFIEGYQTMDALAAVIFAGIIVQSIRAKGYGKTSTIKMTLSAGVIAAVGLLVVYGGLMYLGATASFVSEDIPRTALLVTIVAEIAGDVGLAALGIAVALACLTTAVGLTAATGEFFSKLSENRVTYLQVVTVSTIFSALFAGIGVDGIVRFAVPILVVIYPIVIVLMFMNLLSPVLNESCKYAYVSALAWTLLVSLYDGLSAIGMTFTVWENIVSMIPYIDKGFGWLMASAIGFGIGLIIDRIALAIRGSESWA